MRKFVILILLLLISCTRYAPPDHIKEFVVYPESNNLIGYFILADKEAKQTKGNGKAEMILFVSVKKGINIEEGEKPLFTLDTILYMETRKLKPTDFKAFTRGKGKLKEKVLGYVWGRFGKNLYSRVSDTTLYAKHMKKVKDFDKIASDLQSKPLIGLLSGQMSYLNENAYKIQYHIKAQAYLRFFPENTNDTLVASVPVREFYISEK